MTVDYFGRRDRLFRLPLTPQQKLVLGRLHDYAGNRNAAHPSQKTLAADVSLSVRQLRDYLKSIEAAGFIETKRRRNQPAAHSIKWDAVEAATGTPPKNRQPPTRRKAHQDRQPTAAPSRNQDRRYSVLRTGGGLPSGPAVDRRQNTQEHPRTISKAAPSAISPGEFKSLERGLVRFFEHVEAGIVREPDQLRFLVLWLWCGRNRDQNPVGAFRACLKAGEWNGGDGIEDEVRAYLAGKKPKATDVHPALATAMHTTAVDDVKGFDE